MELLSDYTVSELFDFHFQFQKPKITIEDQLNISGLGNFKHKKYNNLSSGIMNKVKLTLALFTDTPALLLDEPCSNLDARGIEWYKNLANKYSENRLVIVCSNNIEDEFSFCKKSLDMDNFIQIPSS